MKKYNRWKAGMALCMILALVLGVFSGCNKKDKDPAEGISIYVGNTVFDSSLDPVKGGMSYGYAFTNDALTRVDAKGEYVGNLAENWTISDDGLQYTFTLKKDIKFHNGDAFTAKDVVFTYKQVKANQGKNENVDLSKLASVKAVDDHTVVFTLSEAYSSFFDQVALLGIVPSGAYDSKAFDQKPIGTGPWKVIQYDTDQKMIMEANKDYHDGAPSIPRVTILKMDSETAIGNAKSGELDVVMADATYTNEKVKGMKMEKLKTIDVRQISLPVSPAADYTNEKGETVKVGNDVTADPAVRKALAIGIDRKTIIKNGLNGVGTPAVGFVGNLPWANTAAYEDNQKDEAAKIMEGAGWTKNKDGIYEKDGKKCQFPIIAPSGDQERYQLATATAEEAKKIGIQMDISQKTWDEIPKESAGSGVVWGWGQYDPILFKNLFHSKEFTGGGFANTIRYNNPEVDGLIEKALSSTNRQEVIGTWKDVQTKVAEDYGYLYLVNIEHCYFVKDGLDISIDTQISHPHGHGAPIVNNMKDWKVK